jgi:hypothetical protein
MRDWTMTVAGRRFRGVVLGPLTHGQFRAMIGPSGMCSASSVLVVRPAPDPARDARVAARRADDARRAGRALDRLLIPRETYCGRVGVCPGVSVCVECSQVN